MDISVVIPLLCRRNKRSFESKLASEVTVSSEGAWFVCSIMSGFSSSNQPALEPSKTPPPILQGAGRITVDAREKE
jgi:hypothetical protein